MTDEKADKLIEVLERIAISLERLETREKKQPPEKRTTLEELVLASNTEPTATP